MLDSSIRYPTRKEIISDDRSLMKPIPSLKLIIDYKPWYLHFYQKAKVQTDWTLHRGAGLSTSFCFKLLLSSIPLNCYFNITIRLWILVTSTLKLFTIKSIDTSTTFNTWNKLVYSKQNSKEIRFLFNFQWLWSAA